MKKVLLLKLLLLLQVYAAHEDVMKLDPEVTLIFNEAKEGHTTGLEVFLKGKTVEELVRYKPFWSEEDIKRISQLLPESDFIDGDFSSEKAIILKLLASFDLVGFQDYYGSYLLNQKTPSLMREGCYWICKDALKGGYMTMCNLSVYEDLTKRILDLQEKGSFQEEDIWECADMMLKHLDKGRPTSEGKDTNPPEA
ncbi:MAG: hypothetical protein Q8Q56_02110 [Alphaproteobacteria bacterium]|nr:hypothetical protein [Alphaproteobacteria bacterium]